ncbi:MAG: zinc ribbon domain-containing protein [Methanobrevibacter sp.]|uniref:zinc ribbon domain-containing protein n=1 Tax=Methanobrevibacter sp. TaxID=66852 RepID=UPI003F0A2B4B
MKKCPECGNPSYDGAPICGNCGYTFPKPKNSVPKREDIFKKEEPKKVKPSSDESTLDILKEKKLIIGIILLITLILICGIFLTGGSYNTSSPMQNVDSAEYNEGSFSFKYPSDWQETNLTDEDHPGAIFFKTTNNTIVEYYNVSSSASSLKEINQNRISHAQSVGASVTLLETITLDGRNASNIILENADGNYTRYVSMFSDGELYVFRLSGESVNSITSDEINGMLNSADIA